MKKYINTSNYYLSTITSKIEASGTSGTFDVSDTSVDGVTLPTQGYYWVDVDFGDVSKREIFRIVSRDGYTLTYDARISPYGLKTHSIGAAVGLRDFSQLLNSLSTNTDNFGEVEQTGDLSILVRGGKVFASGNALKLYDVADTAITIPASSERYIVLDYEIEEDGIQIAAFTAVEEADLTATGKYPVARIASNANMILTIEDLRSNLIYGGGEGDMKASMYDPDGKQTDAFHMDNMTQGETQQFVSPEDKIYWNEKQEKLIGVGPGQNIHTINGYDILGPGNFSLDTVLTVGWAYEVTEEGVSMHTISEGHKPIDENSFLVITDSGTFLIGGVDYTYDEETNTIVFTNPLAPTEKAYIWTMYNHSEGEVELGSGTVTIKNGDEVLGNFNVNQDFDEDIDISPMVGDATITFNQGLTEVGQITTNQFGDSSIDLEGELLVTQGEYNDLPETKDTDGNWYFIYG